MTNDKDTRKRYQSAMDAVHAPDELVQRIKKFVCVQGKCR